MSIKHKNYRGLPPDPAYELPPYAEDCPCWGCGKLFDNTQLRCDSELCYKCHSIVHRKKALERP